MAVQPLPCPHVLQSNDCATFNGITLFGRSVWLRTVGHVMRMQPKFGLLVRKLQNRAVRRSETSTPSEEAADAETVEEGAMSESRVRKRKRARAKNPRAMTKSNAMNQSGNRIPRGSSIPGKRSGSSRMVVKKKKKKKTKKKVFFERGSATLRKPRFDAGNYPDRKRGRKRIRVPVNLPCFAM
ncbi:hypothetical protein CR513_38906, partial [Mucuna pruriens]